MLYEIYSNPFITEVKVWKFIFWGWKDSFKNFKMTKIQMCSIKIVAWHKITFGPKSLSIITWRVIQKCNRHLRSVSWNPTIFNIIHLVAWSMERSRRLTKHLMFQVSFVFIISCKILCKNPFNLFFYNFTKIKIKSFECPKSIRNYEKIIIGMSDA